MKEWKEDNRFPFGFFLLLLLLRQISTKLVKEKNCNKKRRLNLGRMDGWREAIDIGSCRETSEVSADQLRPLLSVELEFSIKRSLLHSM